MGGWSDSGGEGAGRKVDEGDRLVRESLADADELAGGAGYRVKAV